MTREEILRIAKPILFNTQMVKAILEGRKTETRRVVNTRQLRVLESSYRKEHPEEPDDKTLIKKLCTPPYQPGDVLYVRETWAPMYPDDTSTEVVAYMYKADNFADVSEYDERYPGGTDYTWEGRWRPSIHMPKKAARIFLRVTDVQVERLQEITMSGMQKEGAVPAKVTGGSWQQWQHDYMKPLWDSTNLYGWDANPWVWVIAFEQVEKSEVKSDDKQ